MNNDLSANGEQAPVQPVMTPEPAHMEQTPTAWTILGFLSLQPRSGYEIREAAKRSAGFFWGISDGQLYPQLKVLEKQELIQPFNGVEGPRSRQRWQLTEKGRAALRAWLSTSSAHLHIRDENLVKLLFASQEDPELLLNLIKERRDSFQWFLNTIQEVQPGASWESSEDTSPLTVPLLLKQYGMEFARTALAWCDQAEAVLTAATHTDSISKEE
ncbi:PadR family transcriptional regulator [Paenibacillus sp. GCM10012306]|uniref:PadR family transcriptional regulator n=1 Tax=Paenibacillus sp. GCM10012306 TaxID=3317342 RepID=UPI003616E58B